MPRPWSRETHHLLSRCRSHWVPGGNPVPRANLHSVFVPIYPIMEINALHECMDVLSTPRSKIYISEANTLIKMITRYIKTRGGGGTKNCASRDLCPSTREVFRTMQGGSV